MVKSNVQNVGRLEPSYLQVGQDIVCVRHSLLGKALFAGDNGLNS